MSILSQVTIGITHWPHCHQRVVALEMVLRSLYKHLAGLHEMQIVVSVIPGDSEQSAMQLLARWPEVRVAWPGRHLETGEHIQSIRNTHSRLLLMYVQDDFLLAEPLDVEPLVQFMLSFPSVGLLRMHWAEHPLTRIPSGHDGIDFVDPAASGLVYRDTPHIQSRGLELLAGRYPVAWPDRHWPNPRSCWEHEYDARVKPLVASGRLQVAITRGQSERCTMWRHIKTSSGTRPFVLA